MKNISISTVLVSVLISGIVSFFVARITIPKIVETPPVVVDPKDPKDPKDPIKEPEKPVIGEPSDNLFFTEKEMQVWKSRWQNGPYKNKGDAGHGGQYSPGDVEIINKLAEDFRANPDKDNFFGVSGSGLIKRWDTPEPKQKSVKLVMAAFKAMMDNDASLANLVKENIFKQIRLKRNDITDRSQWDYNLAFINPGFFMPDWGQRLAQSYFYLKPYFSEAESKELNDYLLALADWSYETLEKVMNGNWEDRSKGIPAGGYKVPTNINYNGSPEFTWQGGYPVPVFTQYTYNNRAWMFVRYIAWAGNYYNIEKYKKSAKQFFKEWVQYGVWPDGTMGELYRGPGGYSWSPGHTGYYYAGIILACAIQTADWFARKGDFELYDYTFTSGLYGEYENYIGVGTRGLKKAIDTFASYHTTNKTIRVDNVPLTGHWANNTDGYIIEGFSSMANRYYKDKKIKDAYMRTAPGAIPFPRSVESMAGNNGYGGPLGTYPGVALMFYDLEYINVYP